MLTSLVAIAVPLVCCFDPGVPKQSQEHRLLNMFSDPQK